MSYNGDFESIAGTRLVFLCQSRGTQALAFICGHSPYTCISCEWHTAICAPSLWRYSFNWCTWQERCLVDVGHWMSCQTTLVVECPQTWAAVSVGSIQAWLYFLGSHKGTCYDLQQLGPQFVWSTTVFMHSVTLRIWHWKDHKSCLISQQTSIMAACCKYVCFSEVAYWWWLCSVHPPRMGHSRWTKSALRASSPPSSRSLMMMMMTLICTRLSGSRRSLFMLFVVISGNAMCNYTVRRWHFVFFMFVIFCIICVRPLLPICWQWRQNGLRTRRVRQWRMKYCLWSRTLKTHSHLSLPNLQSLVSWLLHILYS